MGDDVISWGDPIGLGKVEQFFKDTKDALVAIKNNIEDEHSLFRDPFGFIARKLQEANKDIAEKVLPEISRITHPHYDAGWFVDVYRVSWAIAIVVMICVLLSMLVKVGRREVTGSQLIESLTFHAPKFMLSVSFGPLIASVFLTAIGGVTDEFAKWSGVPAQEAANNLSSVINDGDPSKVAGKEIGAILLFTIMIIGLLAILVVAVVLLITQYFLGVAYPIAAAFGIDPQTSRKAKKILNTWFGILITPPFLFFFFGFGLRMVRGMMDMKTGGALATTVNIVAVILMLVIVCLMPMFVQKLAPIQMGMPNMAGPVAAAMGGVATAGAGLGATGAAAMNRMRGGGGHRGGGDRPAGSTSLEQKIHGRKKPTGTTRPGAGKDTPLDDASKPNGDGGDTPPDWESTRPTGDGWSRGPDWWGRLPSTPDRDTPKNRGGVPRRDDDPGAPQSGTGTTKTARHSGSSRLAAGAKKTGRVAGRTVNTAARAYVQAKVVAAQTTAQVAFESAQAAGEMTETAGEEFATGGGWVAEGPGERR